MYRYLLKAIGLLLIISLYSCTNTTEIKETTLIANAGKDQTTIVGSYAIIDPTNSSGSYDWYDWKQAESNPAQIVLFSEDAYPGQKSGIRTVAFIKEGIYKFILIVRNGVTPSNYNGTEASLPDTVTITVEPNPGPQFEDPDLEAIVRAKLKNQDGELNNNELLSIDSLLVNMATPQKISSLKGIEKCKNITFLPMSLQNLSDISPLAGLKNLKVLLLDQNYKISDISPLEGLSNLEVLNVNDNLVTDIGPLRNLVKLNYLDLQFNDIKDISPVSNLRNLRVLLFSGGSFSDITPLKYLVNLKQLWIIKCNVSDISSLSGLLNIENLHLAWNNITDITPLKNLKKLVWIALDKNNVSDITTLKDLQSLSYIRLWDNKIEDISPLVNNPGIGENDIIGLDGNPLNELSISVYIPDIKSRGVLITF